MIKYEDEISIMARHQKISNIQTGAEVITIWMISGLVSDTFGSHCLKLYRLKCEILPKMYVCGQRSIRKIFDQFAALSRNSPSKNGSLHKIKIYKIHFLTK